MRRPKRPKLEISAPVGVRNWKRSQFGRCGKTEIAQSAARLPVRNVRICPNLQFRTLVSMSEMSGVSKTPGIRTNPDIDREAGKRRRWRPAQERRLARPVGTAHASRLAIPSPTNEFLIRDSVKVSSSDKHLATPSNHSLTAFGSRSMSLATCNARGAA